MAVVSESYPSTQPSINQKSDVQAVPSGAEDLWVDAGDMNVLGQMVTSIGRALRLQAAITALAPATAGINNLVFRFTGIDATTGLGTVTTTQTTDLNKLFVAAMEKIEQGGDLDGTASAQGFFGVYAGLVSAASGTYTTGTLYGLSTDGSLITYVSGALSPIGIGIDATTAYVDVSGRIRADAITIEFNNTGELVIIEAGIDHGGLGGLGDDDHVIYILADGTRAFTGDVTLNTGLVVNEGGGDNDTRIEGDTEVNLLFVDAANGRIGIRTASPAHTLDILGGLAIRHRSVATDNTNKSGRFLTGSYVNAEEDIVLVKCDAEVANNFVDVGGGAALFNAATTVRIFTAAINTLMGTARLTIDSDGKALFSGEVEIDGDLNHDGTNLGLYGATPVSQAAHIVDADGTLADITTKFNTLLVALDADAGVGLLAGV